MRIATALLLTCMGLVLPLAPARASGGLSCTSEDAFAVITIESGVTRGMGGPVVQVSAPRRSFATTPWPATFATWPMTASIWRRYWLDGEELRMLLYRERAEGAHGYVQIEVRTSSAEEGLYEGSYTLTGLDMTGDTTGEGRTFRQSGSVQCFVE